MALADEMQTRGIRGTRVTLNCVLLACAQLRDYREARRRFEAHVGAGGEIGADTFNCLFKAAWSGGAFASEAAAIADEMEAAMELDVACEPNAFTELTLRRAGEGNGDAYTPERAAARDALVRFGFEREHAPETPWAPLDERGFLVLMRTAFGSMASRTSAHPPRTRAREKKRAPRGEAMEPVTARAAEVRAPYDLYAAENIFF